MDPESGPAVKFSKRKRAYRARPGPEEELKDGENTFPAETAHEAEVVVPAPRVSPADESSRPSLPSSSAPSASISELLRQRKQSKSRRGGIEFSHGLSPNASDANPRSSLTEISNKSQNGVAAVDMAKSRFAPQTGAVSEANNQHMMSYIDSKMAELQAGPRSSSPLGSTTAAHSATSGILSSLPQRQPAALGQIQEIDLGRDAAEKNIAMTEIATRRLMNGESPDIPSSSSHPRADLGRHGKPRKSRKRRDSDDLKRDQVVEAFLHENKLDLYDDVKDPLAGEAAQDEAGEAADDIIAEKFQRDFLDAIQSRNRMHRARRQPAKTQKKGATDDKSRGPKLGGSRSARAAMHAAGKVKGSKR